jgi:hypothetical protein
MAGCSRAIASSSLGMSFFACRAASSTPGTTAMRALPAAMFCSIASAMVGLENSR